MADMFAISVNVEDGIQQSEAVSSSLHSNDGGDPGAVDKLTEQTEISIVRLDDSAIPRQLCRSNHGLCRLCWSFTKACVT